MLSYSNNVYEEFKSRYEFASKFISGKVLDFASNAFMAYYGSKTLLNAGATEVIRCNMLDEKIEYSKRKGGVDNSVEFDIINDDTFPDKSFDSIVSFETLQHLQNYKDKIKDFFRLLKDEGLLIISIPNKDIHINKNKPNNQLNVELTKDEFIEILQNTFPTVTLYSQRFMTKKEILQNTFPTIVLFSQLLFSVVNILKKMIKSFILQFDKNFNFFQLHFEKTFLRLSKIADNVQNIANKKEYYPIPYENTHKPLFFIAICYKGKLVTKKN